MRNMNKRGNIDSATILVLLFMLSAGIMVAFIILSSGAAGFTNAGSNQSISLLNNAQTMLVRMGNNGFAFMAFGLILFNMLGAFLLFTHPIFVIIDILFMPFSIMIGAILSNAYESSLYTLSVASNFTVMNFIMLHLPTIIVVVDIFTAILAYALVKNR